MKKIGMFAFAALIATGLAFAQTGDQPNAGPKTGARFTPPEKSSISGNLGISRGMLSLESDGILYYVRGLDRFIGFIDGLKEGAALSLEGYAFDSPRLPGSKIFRVTELRLNGKSYDLAPPVEEKPRRFENRPQGLEHFPQGYSGNRRGCYGGAPRQDREHLYRRGPWHE
jgi:hypothetical protein